MADELTGDISEDIVVSGELHIAGTLTGSAQVLKGGHLMVMGAVVGSVQVDEGGSVHVLGSGAFPVTNRGLLILGGTFREEWLEEVAEGPGDVAVWPGSSFTREGAKMYLVDPDGARIEVEPGSKVTATIRPEPRAGFLAYRDGEFVPVRSGAGEAGSGVAADQA